MRTLTTLLVSTLLLFGISLAGNAPAASATGHQAAHACTWNIDWDWHTSTAPNWSQVDWEWNHCGTWQLQQRSSCATRTGTVDVLSGIVTAIELEARATCSANAQRLVACAYRINAGHGWTSWTPDCNPPLRKRG